MLDTLEPNVNFREATCDVPSLLDHELIKRVAQKQQKPKSKIPKRWGRKEALAVRYAANHLDQVDCTWASRINPLTIIMNSMTMCVLGQAFGTFRKGLDEYFSKGAPVTQPGKIQVFAAPSFIEGHFVKKAWRREIRARR